MTLAVAAEAQIGTALRTLLNNNGFSAVRIIGYEHNWVDAAAYPVQLVSLKCWSCATCSISDCER